MENNFMSNFGMIIPQGPYVRHKPKPIPKWKKAVCFLIGHKWINPGVTFYGPGFPKKCARCKKDKWFKKPNLHMRLTKWADKTLDKLWVPLCKIGVHRYKSHYGFSSFSFGGNNSAPDVHQHIYKCSFCKKTKTVNIK